MNKYIIITTLTALISLMLGLFLQQNSSRTQDPEVHQEVGPPSGKGGKNPAKVVERNNTKETEHDEDLVQLSDSELQEFGIQLGTVGVAALTRTIDLFGEVVLNTDQTAHVVTPVPGVVREVLVSVGDVVKPGELLAVLDSGELAEIRSALLSASEREALAERNYQRERQLWEKKVTSDREMLEARSTLAEAKIQRKSIDQQLRALGLSDKVSGDRAKGPGASLIRFELRAPGVGTIIERHMTVGEKVGTETVLFTLSDLSSVWVDVQIYQKDLPDIGQGQSVEVFLGEGFPTVEGKVAWIAPLVNVDTRTTRARIVLPNPEGRLRPGLFVVAKVTVERFEGIVIPKSALQNYEGHSVVFIRTPRGFRPQPVELGRENATEIEVRSGLAVGQTYVRQGAFTLKAQLSKKFFGEGHNH